MIIVSVLGHPKGVEGSISNFPCEGGMDVSWNDLIWKFTNIPTTNI